MLWFMLQVGYGNTSTEDTVILAVIVNSPLTVNYIGFSTGWGGHGEFRLWAKTGGLKHGIIIL